MNNNKIIINKIKKVYSLIKKLSQLSNKEQIYILNKTINILEKNLKKQDKTNKTENFQNNTSLNRIYEKIFDKINSLGYPFKKHYKYKKIKEPTLAYKKSLKQIEKYYKKHRSHIIEVFKLAQEYFNNPRFVYKPEQTINIYDFFRYSKDTLQFMPHLQKYTKSWFEEFAKGRNHIEENFINEIKDDHKLITQRFIDIWEDYKGENISKYNHKFCIIYTKYLWQFCKLNKISTSTINDIIKKFLKNKDFSIDSTKFFTTDYFWNNKLPNLLIEYGIYKNKREIKLINLKGDKKNEKYKS